MRMPSVDWSQPLIEYIDESGRKFSATTRRLAAISGVDDESFQLAISVDRPNLEADRNVQLQRTLLPPLNEFTPTISACEMLSILPSEYGVPVTMLKPGFNGE